MYLLTIAIPDVTAATRHGSCGLRIIATNSPVSSAPSGNIHRPSRQRRITTSIAMAVKTAAATSGLTRATPSANAAATSNTTSAMMRSPLGVRKNRRRRAKAARRVTMAAVLATRHPSRFVSVETWCDDHPLDSVSLEKGQTALRAQHECRGAESVGNHRDGSDDGHARGVVG